MSSAVPVCPDLDESGRPLSPHTPANLNAALTIPPENASTAVKESEALFIHDFLRDHPECGRTLEVGMGYGRSASHIMAATGKAHVAMDPFQDTYDRLGLRNLEGLGFDEQLEFHDDFSHNVLPKLHGEGRKFDFAFIDGDHKFDGILIDFYYADLMLDPGGYVLLHDTWMRSTQMVMGFVRKNRKDYEEVPTHLRNLCLFKKTGTDERNGMFFREFYNTRNILVHPAISYMSEGKDSALKRFLLWLKRKIR
ncbi:MAG: class I SAM-dependent methyltransferase [Verrucomicrobiales bacterium]|nr:class I SAM-dependent methyltransferase [Verrucomicrobiales bacterium]